MDALTTLLRVVDWALARKKSPHRAPTFANTEVPDVIAKGMSKHLSWQQALGAARKNSGVDPVLRRMMVAQIAKAGQRRGHPHVYKFKLQTQTNKHLAAIKKDYKEFVRHAVGYLTKGVMSHKALAAKGPNEAVVLDQEEKKQLRAGIVVLVLSLKTKMDRESKKVYGDAYRRGKTEGVRKLATVGQKTKTGATITGKDLKDLNEWYDYHDEATAGLADDIMERMDEIFEDGEFEDEEEFRQQSREALEAEDYRLPLYAWMAFPIAEQAQIGVFKEFNAEQGGDEASDEWKYKWLTMMDDDVCAICEALGEMAPQYLEDWDYEPGDVHIGCRCDLEPVPPAEGG